MDGGEHEFLAIPDYYISLIIILFFRRIDKRTINFNKFKRYADKLSSDFNHFLFQKREEFEGSIKQLERAIQKAGEILAKIEMADASLKSSFVGIKGEKSELELIKLELTRLKTVKRDITTEIENIEKNLPSMKKMSKRIIKMGLDVALNEKSIKDAFLQLSDLDEKVREKTDKALEDVKESIVTKAQSLFLPIVGDYRENLELMKTSQEEELEKFRQNVLHITGEVEEKINEIDQSVLGLQGKMVTLENESVLAIESRISELDKELENTRGKIEQAGKESIQIFLNRAEGDYKKYISFIEGSITSMKGDIFKKIEEEEETETK